MKRKAAYLFVLATFMTVFLANDASAHVASIEGNKIWTYHMTETSLGPVDIEMTVKTTVIKNAKTFYVTGVAYVPNDNPVYLTGTVILAGTSYIWNLTATQVSVSGQQLTGTIRNTMNAATLSGDSFTITKKYDPISMQFTDFYHSGTLGPGTPVMPQ